jgi:ACT domain-containing protein
MKAVLTVIGKDKQGIIAKVSGALYQVGANIEDVSQTVMQDYFVMIMMADLSGCKLKINEITDITDKLAAEIGVSIKLQHEEIFNAMHKV